MNVTLHPEHRGVINEVVVEVASSAPFGLLWWGRDIVVPPHSAAACGPALGGRRCGHRSTRSIAPSTVAAPVPSGLGDPRGVRPYAPGDLRRSLHWPATAHVGSLMVRETERAVEDPVVLDVVLPDDAAAAEADV